MEVASSSTTAMQSRQKRVLPSRSTRGGPGVGNCDMDMLILDTQRRRSENEPLIPTDTRFLFTTDSSYSGEQDDGTQANIQLNTVALDRYFEKPEVLHAFREQSIIETPVFESIAELSSVGGRFRPRGAEDESAETSDAAYERRHKKYEAAEKRHRSREKEKLKHEHYKLKERIEQLRAMDSAAFMSVPASYFSPPPPGLANVDQNETPTSSVYTTAFNGPTPNPEGDRRKEEMLNMAIALEQRYRALLPSDKHRKTHEMNIPESSMRTQVLDEDSEGERASHPQKDNNIRFRLPARASNSSTPVPSPSVNKSSKKSTSNPNKLPQAVRVLKQGNHGAGSPALSLLTGEPSSRTTPSVDIEMGTPEPLHTTVPISPSQPPLSDERSSSNYPPVYPDHAIQPPIAVLESAGPKKRVHKKKVPADGPSAVKPQAARRGGGGRFSAIRTEVTANDDGESEKDFSDEEGRPAVPVKAMNGGKSRGGKAKGGSRKASRQAAAAAANEAANLEQATGIESAELDARMEVPEIACETSPPATEDEKDELIASPPPDDMPSVSIGPSRPQKRRKTAQKLAEALAELPVEQGSVAPEPAESVSVITAPRAPPRGARQYRSEDGEMKWTAGAMLLAALNSNNFREEKRHTKAFGVPVPEILKQEYFYELPHWVHPIQSDPSEYMIDKRRSVSTRPSRRIHSATPAQHFIPPPVMDQSNMADGLEDSKENDELEDPKENDELEPEPEQEQVDEEMGEPAESTEAREGSPEVQESFERGAPRTPQPRTPQPGKSDEVVADAIEQRASTPSPDKIPQVIETPDDVPKDVEMADTTETPQIEVLLDVPEEAEIPNGTAAATPPPPPPVATPPPPTAEAEPVVQEPEVAVEEEQPTRTTRRGTRRSEKPPSKRQPKRGAKKAAAQESPIAEEAAPAPAPAPEEKETQDAMEVVPAAVVIATGSAPGPNVEAKEGAASPQSDTTEIWPNPHILPRDLSSKPNDDEEALEW